MSESIKQPRQPCMDVRVGAECMNKQTTRKDVCDACGTCNNHFGFFLDDLMGELFYELERIQDGQAGHRVAFKAPSKEKAIQIMCERLKPFLLKAMYACDAHGREVQHG